jgi:hypothetical protein
MLSSGWIALLPLALATLLALPGVASATTVVQARGIVSGEIAPSPAVEIADAAPIGDLQEFREAEREAREAGRGLWAEAEPQSLVIQPVRDDCIPRSQCCRVCSKGKACGASCISRSYTCRPRRGATDDPGRHNNPVLQR